MAGRPKKVIETDKQVVDKKTIEKKTTPLSPIEQENKQLRSELDELKQMILNLTQNQQNQTQSLSFSEPTEIILTKDIEDNEYSEIRPNAYIKVMSLNFGKLVLSTEGKGRGKVFVFNKFGEVKNIIYSDLANLIHHQQSFAEQGRFFIFDNQVVKNHGLVQYYNKFLTKDKIENILDYGRDEIVSLFNNTTNAQREVIVNLLIKKIVEGQDVDISKVDIISRLNGGQSIYDIARDKIELKNIK